MPESLQAIALKTVERFLEDEALTGDLTDAQATPLLQWVTQEATRLATKDALTLPYIEARLRDLKLVMLSVSRHATDESTGESLVEAAKQALLQKREEEKQEVYAQLLLEKEEHAQLAKLAEPLTHPKEVHHPIEELAELVHDAARRAVDYVRHLPEHREHPPKDPGKKDNA